MLHLSLLASPCSHKQTLKLSELVGTHPTEPHLATPPIIGQVLDSGVDYKHLTLHSTQHPPVDESYREVCAMLFNFPRIRLNVLEVGCFETNTRYINTLHMAAQHPDLSMRSLKIRLPLQWKRTVMHRTGLLIQLARHMRDQNCCDCLSRRAEQQS